MSFPFLAKGVGRGGLGDLTSPSERLRTTSQLRDSAGLAPASPRWLTSTHRAGAHPPLERSLAVTARAEWPARQECRTRGNNASSSAPSYERGLFAAHVWQGLHSGGIASFARESRIRGNFPGTTIEYRRAASTLRPSRYDCANGVACGSKPNPATDHPGRPTL